MVILPCRTARLLARPRSCEPELRTHVSALATSFRCISQQLQSVPNGIRPSPSKKLAANKSELILTDSLLGSLTGRSVVSFDVHSNFGRNMPYVWSSLRKPSDATSFRFPNYWEFTRRAMSGPQTFWTNFEYTMILDNSGRCMGAKTCDNLFAPVRTVSTGMGLIMLRRLACTYTYKHFWPLCPVCVSDRYPRSRPIYQARPRAGHKIMSFYYTWQRTALIVLENEDPTKHLHSKPRSDSLHQQRAAFFKLQCFHALTAERRATYLLPEKSTPRMILLLPHMQYAWLWLLGCCSTLSTQLKRGFAKSDAAGSMTSLPNTRQHYAALAALGEKRCCVYLYIWQKSEEAQKGWTSAFLICSFL